MACDSPTEANPHLERLLLGIHGQLCGGYLGGRGGTAASAGHDRERFVKGFLSRVLPPPFRFGSGEVTDIAGKLTGQLDIVVEFPILPSVQLLGTYSTSRLYLAEGVAAVIEVKSDLAAQWSRVLATARKVKAIDRPGRDTTPFLAVGYTGWKKPKTLTAKLQETADVDGALVIEPGIFVSRASGSAVNHRAWALWALVCMLHHAATANPAHFSPEWYGSGYCTQ